MQQAVVKLTSRMSSSTKARLTLFLRLTIFTLAIGAGVAFTVALELFSWTYWYRPVCEDFFDKDCLNEPQVPGTPMVITRYPPRQVGTRTRRCATRSEQATNAYQRCATRPGTLCTAAQWPSHPRLLTHWYRQPLSSPKFSHSPYCAQPQSALTILAGRNSS